MVYFGKPNAYKNISSSQYTVVSKIKNTYQTYYQSLLDQITSQSPEKGTCTCS